MICAAALILMLDASGSMINEPFNFLLEGHAQALRSEEVKQQVSKVPLALSVYLFNTHATLLVPWVLVQNANDLEKIASTISEYKLSAVGGTDIGYSVMQVIPSFSQAPCDSNAQIIDIVTDGESEPTTAHKARQMAEERLITINGLGIQGASIDPAEWLNDHLKTQDGFVFTVSEWPRFASAIRAKLRLELAQGTTP